MSTLSAGGSNDVTMANMMLQPKHGFFKQLTMAAIGWYSDKSVFLEDPGVYLRPIV